MTPQAAGIAVAFVAALRGALKGFLVPVRQQMTVEMVLTFKGLVAHGAKIFALIAVGEPMLGQSRGIPEHFVAQIALLRTGLGGIEPLCCAGIILW
jgi:hypothetical protein